MEIQQLAATMGEMAENIQQRDQGLRQALEQRKMMIREIHHRVKTNLQIVASLLDLEARRVKEPSARAALTMTHTRINAIALANRVLEEVDAQTVVNLRTLLRELAMLLHDAFGRGRDRQDIAVDAPDILLETDIAVPLALWLVEQVADIYRGAIEGQEKAGTRWPTHVPQTRGSNTTGTWPDLSLAGRSRATARSTASVPMDCAAGRSAA